MAVGARLTLQGRYLAAITGIVLGERTGCLRVTGDGAQRYGLIMGGELLFLGALPDGKELVPPPANSGVVGESGAALWTLLAADSLSEDPSPSQRSRPGGLAEHLSRQGEQGISQVMSCSEIDWNFEPLEALPRANWDPSLASGAKLLRAVWVGARGCLAMDQLLNVVVDPSAGKVEAAPHLNEILTAFEVGEPLSQLGAALKQPKDVEELLSSIPDRSGHLVALLWVLETIGAVSRSGRTLDAESKKLAAPPARRKPSRPKPPKKSSVSKKKPADIRAGASSKSTGPPKRGQAAPGSNSGAPADKVAALLRTVHLHRMGKDYFEFLDLTASATPSQVASACERLRSQWTRASETSGLSAEGKSDAKQLLRVVARVEGVLMDATTRREYVGQLRAGTHLRTGEEPEPKAAAGGGDPSHEEARRCLASGDFARARTLLEALRRDHPSSASILADLGWAHWSSDPVVANREAAEEYLRLALTFDPGCSAASKYLAKIAKEAGGRASGNSSADKAPPKKKGRFWRRDG